MSPTTTTTQPEGRWQQFEPGKGSVCVFEYRVASQDNRFLNLSIDNDIIDPGEYDLTTDQVQGTLQSTDRDPADCFPGRRIATANVQIEGTIKFTNPSNFDDVASQLCIETVTITEKEGNTSILNDLCIEAFGYTVGDG